MSRKRLEYAGFWIRVRASIIDFLMLVALMVPVGFYIYWKNEGITPVLIGFILSSFVFAIVVILFWIYRSATPGKMILGLKILDLRTGDPITAKQSIIRCAGYCFSVLPLFLGVFWIVWDGRRQGWHDKLCGSVVVRDINYIKKVML